MVQYQIRPQRHPLWLPACVGGHDRKRYVLRGGNEPMKKLLIFALAAILLTACGQSNGKEQEAMYVNITAQEAKTIMDTEQGYVILDTRTREEYDQGHIPGAIQISHDEITEKAEEVLTDKDQLILVYCRSGRRSKIAAEALVELGYTNIKEFGGIIDWPYEVEQ
jgi:rhodanese-related sulfurtransferase